MNIYDFDKTIFHGDSTFSFYRYCVQRYPGVLLELPGTIHAWVRYYIFKRGNKTQFKERMYRFLRHVADVNTCVDSFWKDKKDGVKSWYLIKRHDDDIIISASPEFLIFPICKILDVHAIASRVDPKTGLYNGINCHGEEKVRRLYEEYPGVKIDEFYSDALSDTPLARLAKKAYLVKNNLIKDWKL